MSLVVEFHYDFGSPNTYSVTGLFPKLLNAQGNRLPTFQFCWADYSRQPTTARRWNSSPM